MRDNASKNTNNLPENVHDFIAFCLNLALNPRKLVKGLLRVGKLRKRLESEDSRKNWTPKLPQIVPFRDQIFHSCSELCHCDINDCIKLSCITKYLQEKMFIEKGDITVQRYYVGTETMNDFYYTSDSFVAVVSD